MPQAMVDQPPSGQYTGLRGEKRTSAPPPQPTLPEAILPSDGVTIKHEFYAYNPYDSSGMECAISWSDMLKDEPPGNQLFGGINPIDDMNARFPRDLDAVPIVPLTPDTQPGTMGFSHADRYSSPNFLMPQQQQQQQQLNDYQPPDFSTVQVGSHPASNLPTHPAETPQSQLMPSSMSQGDTSYLPSIDENTVSMVNFDSTEFGQLLSNIPDDSHCGLQAPLGPLFVNGGPGQNQF